MKNWYRILPDIANYATLEIEESKLNISDLQCFLGDIERPADFSKSWQIPKVKLSEERRRGDFPGLMGFHIVFSERALELLDCIASDSVTYLPLLCESSTQYYLLKMENIIDCLDYSKSEILTLYDGRIREIKHGVFDPQFIQESEVFSIPNLNRPIVSENFKLAVESHDLEGLIFRKIS